MKGGPHAAIEGDDAPPRQQLLRIHGLSVAWVVPLLLLGLIVVVDVSTTEKFRVISWIVLVPGTAAAICGVCTTAGFAVLSLLAYILVDAAWPSQYQAGLPDIVLVALGGFLATLACVVRLRAERLMLHMRDVVDTTRRTVLRRLPPAWAGLENAAVYLSADTDARVGGDFYDIQPGPHGPRVFVGDVQGKGLGAVDTAVALLGTFREAAYHERDLAAVAVLLETRMLRHRRYMADLGRKEGDRFATALLVGFPVRESGFVEIVNFGHEPPMAVAPGGARLLSPGDGLPLGMSEFADGPPRVRRVALGAGETLLLVTDGVTEARDAEGVFYPVEREVARAVAADPRTAEPRRLVSAVRAGTLRHTGGHLGDDTTVFAVRRVLGWTPAQIPVRGRLRS
ncbi:PP2C family protein-serine/threonine phosphatase [Streptomyces sp. NPDC001508]|uniref:PP2C family protein-serine/threonine phosphatase n=1 Tax=Streptomyces sp. NPDC001508 TaxID=3154656 RepID=UPI0033226F39